MNRSKQIFYLLMIVAAISVFVYPIGTPTSSYRPSIGNFFAPVSRPVTAMVGWFTASKSGNVEDDITPDNPRSIDEVRRENAQLHDDVVSLAKQIDQLKQRLADLDYLGDIKSQCVVVKVAGNSATPGSSSLSLLSSSAAGLKQGQKVLYPGGIVGEISLASLTGASVRPIVARDVKLLGSFVRYRKVPGDKYVADNISLPATILAGNGKQLAADKIAFSDVQQSGLKVDDVAVLEDDTWPPALRGRRLGRVVSITQKKDVPGFADIRVEPFNELLQLRQVMVLAK